MKYLSTETRPKKSALSSVLMSDSQRWRWVTVYAIAMAWVESAVVFYLRTMIDRIEPYQTNPLPMFGGLAFVKAELVREAATLIMLFAVGWLAGKTWRSRLAYALVAFGMWDIFYYVFLNLLTGWPHSLMDWDILFLLPLPWWGPIIAPMGIAGLMIVFGTVVSQMDEWERPIWPQRRSVVLCFVGALLALFVFMTDALRVAGQGEMALRNLLPVSFNWPLFGLGWLLMAVPVLEVIGKAFPSRLMGIRVAKAN